MTPIVLLPGHMCDARMWAPAVEALTGAGYEASVANLVRSNSIDGLARDVLGQAPPRFVAVGLSLGGIVAMALARMAPERVAGLVLADTNASADLPERAAARPGQRDAVRVGRLAQVVADEMKPAYLAAANRGRRDLLDLFAAMADSLGAQAFVRQSEALQSRADARPGLGALRCPVLLLCGAEDALCPPAWHEDMAALIPDATLEVISGAGHMLPLEQPDAFNRTLLGWLDRHQETSA